MSFKKEIKQQLNLIEEQLKQLSPQILEKARKYDELKERLKYVTFDVKNVSLFTDSMGNIGVKIAYNVPEVKIYCDSDGNIEKNNRFIAINSLDLVSFSDMKKIQVKIDEAKIKNK